MKSPFLTLKKYIAFVILLCFSFSSAVEARNVKHLYSRHANKLQRQKAAVKAKQLAAPKARARKFAAPQRNVRQLPAKQARAKQAAVPQRRGRQVQVPKRNVRQLPAKQARAKQAAAPQRRGRQVQVPQRNVRQLPLQQARAKQAAVPQRRGRQVQVPKRNVRQLPAKQGVAPKAIVKKPAIVPVKPQVINFLSLLKPYTQRNAKLGGLDHLYSKNILGQGQTVAVIEYSGVWQEMKDVINNKFGFPSSEIKERYKRNFLTPIGSKEPGSLHPEGRNDWLLLATKGEWDHGSSVSSVVMDFAPETKVKPVGTYNSPETPTQPCHFYDISDALMDLSTHKDVGIINISGGWVKTMDSEQRMEQDANGQWLILHKTKFTPKIVEAFKAVAKAGKVVVLAAGNEGKEIQPLKFKQESGSGRDELIGHLLETLDPETRKSILIAGNLDPNTRRLSLTSNKPGNGAAAQERFLAVPGYNMSSYVDYIETGASFSAPYLCAVIALLSSKGYAPKRVINALLQTAEKDPDIRTYGSGRMIRAHKALEYLESGN